MPTTAASTARRSYVRTVSRQGNSIMLAVPKAILLQLDLIPGDRVEIICDPDDRGWHVVPLRSERDPRRQYAPLIPKESVAR